MAVQKSEDKSEEIKLRWCMICNSRKNATFHKAQLALTEKKLEIVNYLKKQKRQYIAYNAATTPEQKQLIFQTAYDKLSSDENQQQQQENNSIELSQNNYKEIENKIEKIMKQEKFDQKLVQEYLWSKWSRQLTNLLAKCDSINRTSQIDDHSVVVDPLIAKN